MGQTLIFYLVIGLAVAVAVFVRTERGDRRETIFRTATAAIFWPLYLPMLLSRPDGDSTAPAESAGPPRESPHDEMSTAIAQVEAELDSALSGLDGWAEDVLAREKDRLEELRAAWSAQATRIREMDRLLAQPEFAETRPEREPREAPGMAAAALDHADRRRQSEHARGKNIARLRQVRRQAFDDLMGTLAWVRELVSMIHLAKFTGAPASRAEELITQIAAAVEGVSAVTWQESNDAARCESLAATASV